MIYLDYAAATPMSRRARKAMEEFFSEDFFNPSASYLAATRVREKLDRNRAHLAHIIGAKPAEIILTAGATESINLALGGARGRILTLAIEHEAVLNIAKAKNGKILPVKKDGRVDLLVLEKTLAENPEIEIVSVGYVNSEIGTVQDLKSIAKIVKKIRDQRAERAAQSGESATRLLFHTDASQAAGYLDLNVARLGVDMMTLNAAKCYGPKQVGLLFLRAGVFLQPLFYGGGQEMGLRGGTENPAGAAAFAVALSDVEKHRATETKRLEILRKDLVNFLLAEFPDIEINGSKKHYAPNILNFSIPNLDGERAVFALDERGILLATGSACAANRGTRSHVLQAIGVSSTLADGSLRISFGRSTTDQEISRLKPILSDVLHEQLKFGQS